MTPNWESIPQNHPSPKVAVSYFDGAEASMGGMVGGVFIVFGGCAMVCSFDCTERFSEGDLPCEHPQSRRQKVITHNISGWALCPFIDNTFAFMGDGYPASCRPEHLSL